MNAFPKIPTRWKYAIALLTIVLCEAAAFYLLYDGYENVRENIIREYQADPFPWFLPSWFVCVIDGLIASVWIFTGYRLLSVYLSKKADAPATPIQIGELLPCIPYAFFAAILAIAFVLSLFDLIVRFPAVLIILITFLAFDGLMLLVCSCMSVYYAALIVYHLLRRTPSNLLCMNNVYAVFVGMTMALRGLYFYIDLTHICLYY